MCSAIDLVGCFLAACLCNRVNQVGQRIQQTMFDDQLFPLTVANDVIFDKSEQAQLIRGGG